MARGLLEIAIATGLGVAGAALLKRQAKNKTARAATHAGKTPTKSAEPKTSQPSRGAKSKSRRAAATRKRAAR
jgi:uncharacterized protein HemX